MQEIRRLEEMRAFSGHAQCEGRSIGFVPTMGYLHAGHARLIEEARSENELIAVSIYVNPSQFGPHEDFGRYPRDLEHDRAVAAQAGGDILFVPDDASMYPGGLAGQEVWINPGRLADHLCGPSRPGHFRGVATVVGKLFNIVRPDRAYFGQKDMQQAIIIQHMVRDLAIPVKVRTIETVRDPDGLALSSRNVNLTAEDRAEAPALRAALLTADRLYRHGERNPGRLLASVRSFIEARAPRASLDYVEIVGLGDLQPVSEPLSQPALLAIAAYFGDTRLIDNITLSTA